MNRVFSSQYSFSGSLLVAAPHWDDPLFHQSVCLVVNHSKQGAIGVLLNKSISIDTQSFLEQLGAQPTSEGSRWTMFLGGPNSGPVVAMHQRQDLAEFAPAEGVYFAAQIDSLKKLVADQNSWCRFYVGQANWKAGQLDQQFLDGCWLPQPVQSRVVLEATDSMWRVAMREAGNILVQGMLGNAVVPTRLEYN